MSGHSECAPPEIRGERGLPGADGQRGPRGAAGAPDYCRLGKWGLIALIGRLWGAFSTGICETCDVRAMLICCGYLSNIARRLARIARWALLSQLGVHD